MSKYRGKYPQNIRSVSQGGRGSPVVLVSNAGEVIQCDPKLVAASNGGKLPAVGQDIRDFHWAQLFTVDPEAPQEAPEALDMTPTWCDILPALVMALEEGDSKARAVALEELQRMAKLADERNQLIKAQGGKA